MKVKLYSSQDLEHQPKIFSKADLTSPSQDTISTILSTIATSKLITTKGFLSGLTVGLSTAVDAIQICSLGFLIPALKQSLDEKNPPSPAWLFPKTDLVLNNTEIALWSSFMYLAMLIGGIFATPITKYKGERFAMLSSLWICLIFLLLEAQATNFVILMACQIIVGFAVGYRIPIIYSNMSSVFITGKTTVFVITSASFIWTVGSVYASFMGWFSIGQIWSLSWRVYLVICAVPSLFLLIMGYLFIYEPVHTGIQIQHSLQPALDIAEMVNDLIDRDHGRFLVENTTKTTIMGSQPHLTQSIKFDSSLNSDQNNSKGQIDDNNSNDDLWLVDVTKTDEISVFYHYLSKYWANIPDSLLNESAGDNGSLSINSQNGGSVKGNDATPLLSTGPLSHETESHNTFSSVDIESYNTSADPDCKMAPSSSSIQNYETEKWWLLGLLCVAWFIVSFAASGFSSFLPTLWDALIPEEKRKDNPDISYIIAAVYSSVQAPAGFMNIIAMSRWFPPMVLFCGAVISAVATITLTLVYLSSVYAAMAFVFLSQFGTSTVFCAVNYVGVAYFQDTDKVLMYAIQVSVGKLGAFIAQYAFAYLAEESPRVLLILVSILNSLVVIACWWLMAKVSKTQ